MLIQNKSVPLSNMVVLFNSIFCQCTCIHIKNSPTALFNPLRETSVYQSFSSSNLPICSCFIQVSGHCVAGTMPKWITSLYSPLLNKPRELIKLHNKYNIHVHEHAHACCTLIYTDISPRK